jgi:glycosyltransferase involved in cell wall biosynthesis
VFGGLLANLVRVRRLRKALRDAGAPVAIAFIMPTAVLTLFAALGLNVRVVACERNDPERQSFGVLWELLRRVAYPWADVVTANSHGALTTLKAYVPNNKLVYVANPLAAPPQGEPAALKAPTILSVGRLNHQKAHDVLLEAFALFAAKHADWRLAIMGNGPEAADLRNLASRLGMSDRVDWLGTQLNPYPWLRSARIFALVSRHEGTPNALLEAMSCGLPCIVSNASPGPLELVEDGMTGLVVPVDDHRTLAASIGRLADDANLSRRLGAAARARVRGENAEMALRTWETAVELASRR